MLVASEEQRLELRTFLEEDTHLICKLFNIVFKILYNNLIFSSMRLKLNEHNSGKGEIYAATMALHRVAHWEDYK